MMFTLRPEQPADAAAIAHIVGEAFDGSEIEPKLVALIRQRDQALISLVAVQDEAIVGHVLVSPIELDLAADTRFGGVAPLSVAVAQQSKGIGSALMRAAIDESRERGLAALFLLGNPPYYQRFGFIASHLGNEYGATDAFMHLELIPGCLEGKTGVARYVSAFQEAGA